MASNCDVQERTSSVKKQKIECSSSGTLENNIKMDVNLFSDKFSTSSEILKGKFLFFFY